MRASSDHTLSEHVERLVLLGKADLVGTGNALGNIINGNAGANLLNGLDGNDRLNGRGGVDTMAGGTGNDVYVVDDVRDVLIENADQGIDRVASVVDWTLGAAFERLTLLGTADINGTGNALANAIRGNDGANSLFGGAGRDWLDGRLGADTLAGGADNDIMFVDNLDDVVIEEADGGMDRVVSSVDWTLGDYVEQLVLRGSADLSGTGNALGNLMVGNAGPTGWMAAWATTGSTALRAMTSCWAGRARTGSMAALVRTR